MEEQEIKITLEEYKMLRDKVEEYYKLAIKYNQLAVAYNEIAPPEPQKVKKKNPIGFRNE